jgi:hypothetical protein
MLHTARLGIPVLDLIKPAYVWVGLPLAVLGFFSKAIISRFKRQAEDHGVLLTKSISQPFIVDSDDYPVLRQNFVDTAIRLAPWFAPKKVSTGLLEAAIGRAERKARKLTTDPRANKIFDRLLRMSMSVTAIWAFTNLIVTIAGTCAAVVVYAWVIYPWLPQTIGGGAPRHVQLVVDGSKFPDALRRSTGLQGLWTKEEPPLLTAEVDLLYKTSDAYWIRSDDRLFALNKDLGGCLFRGEEIVLR